MRVGGDVLAAFLLAVGVHAGLGLGLSGGARAPGAGRAHGAQPAVLAPAGTAALVAAWRAPPVAGAAPEAPLLAEGGAADLARPPATAAGVGRPTALARLPELAADAVDAAPAPPLSPPVAARLAVAPGNMLAPAAEGWPPGPPARPSADTAPRLAAPTGLPMAKASLAPPMPEQAPPLRVFAAGPGTTTPRPRPEAAPTAAGEPALVAARPGAAVGGGGRAASGADSRALRAEWAGTIGARIARAQRHPGRAHGGGRVRLSLVVTRDGRLAEARVVASSGSSGLDRAALDAAHRAAPFPRAPEGLPDDWVRFGQWVAFRPE